MVENVFSMMPADRAVFLDVELFLVDTRWFSHMRRPRLFWCSWDVQESADVDVSAKNGGYCEIRPKLSLPYREHWEDDGFTFDSGADNMYSLCHVQAYQVAASQSCGDGNS